MGVQYEAPYISGNKLSLIIVRFTTIAVAFFTMIAVAVFGAAPIRAEFCKAFDPDANTNGLPCGFGNGFAIAIGALVISLLEVALAWLFMGLHLPQTYAFTSKGGFESSGAGSIGGGGGSADSAPLTSGGYNADSGAAGSSGTVAVSLGGSSGGGGGGYQTIGGST